MSDKNTFTTSFGKEPSNFISRSEEETIIGTFSAELPVQQVFMITGVRGSGKTALLTKVKRNLSEDERWITVELNSETDMMRDLIAKLCDNPLLRTQFIKARINLSFFGINLEVEDTAPINSESTALRRMLNVVKNLNKRLLITIDEVVNNGKIRSFVSEYQILIREDYPVYLIMTGLFKNIYDLQNVKTLTFLYRAPKIALGKLNTVAVINSYKNILGISTSEAAKMADEVKGYAFAYQLYGSLYYEMLKGKKTNIDEQFKETLAELVYEKLWSELSIKDKEIMTVIASHGDSPVKIGEIIAEYSDSCDGKMTDKLMSVYRERLKREGMIETPSFGYIQIALPKFADYINEYGAIL